MVETNPAMRPEGDIFDSFDRLKDMSVKTSDGETLGNVTAILHPDSEAVGVAGSHCLAVMPGVLRNIVEGADVAYIPESAIDRVDEDGIVLNVTADWINEQDWRSIPPGYVQRDWIV